MQAIVTSQVEVAAKQLNVSTEAVQHLLPAHQANKTSKRIVGEMQESQEDTIGEIVAILMWPVLAHIIIIIIVEI